MASNAPPNAGNNAAAEREQKMLESSMENLSTRLTEVRNSLTALIVKVETDPTLNWSSFLDSFALISGQLNSLMKNVKADATKNTPISYRYKVKKMTCVREKIKFISFQKVHHSATVPKP